MVRWQLRAVPTLCGWVISSAKGWRLISSGQWLRLPDGTRGCSTGASSPLNGTKVGPVEMSSYILASVRPLRYRRSLPQTCHQKASSRLEVGSLTFLAVLVYTTDLVSRGAPGRGQSRLTFPELPDVLDGHSSSAAHRVVDAFRVPEDAAGQRHGRVRWIVGHVGGQWTGEAQRYRSDNGASSRRTDGKDWEASRAWPPMASGTGRSFTNALDAQRVRPQACRPSSRYRRHDKVGRRGAARTKLATGWR